MTLAGMKFGLDACAARRANLYRGVVALILVIYAGLLAYSAARHSPTISRKGRSASGHLPLAMALRFIAGVPHSAGLRGAESRQA